MKTAILTNTVTHERVTVHTTKNHPDCSYGYAMWVDDNGQAYMQEGLEKLNPYYQLADVHETVTLRMEEAIERSGMTKTTIAKAMGISPSSLANILNNENPRVSTLFRMAEAMGMDIREMFW